MRKAECRMQNFGERAKGREKFGVRNAECGIAPYNSIKTKLLPHSEMCGGFFIHRRGGFEVLHPLKPQEMLQPNSADITFRFYDLRGIVTEALTLQNHRVGNF